MIDHWTIIHFAEGDRPGYFSLVHLTEKAMLTGPVQPHHAHYQKIDHKMNGNAFRISFVASRDRQRRDLIRKTFLTAIFRGVFAYLSDADVAHIKLAAS